MKDLHKDSIFFQNSLVKVNEKQFSSPLSKNNSDHNIEECMKSLFMKMRAQFGREINWFRSIGGMSVAVSIPPSLFA